MFDNYPGIEAFFNQELKSQGVEAKTSHTKDSARRLQITFEANLVPPQAPLVEWLKRSLWAFPDTIEALAIYGQKKGVT